MVVWVALGLFRMVASIYKPFSVNALGNTRDFEDMRVYQNKDLK